MLCGNTFIVNSEDLLIIESYAVNLATEVFHDHAAHKHNTFTQKLNTNSLHASDDFSFMLC